MIALIRLQQCDVRLEGFRSRKQEGPNRIQRLKDGLNVIERRSEEELARLQGYEREKRQTEQGIEDIENRIEKSNTKLSGIKSNKEYQAALKEIDDLQREKSLVEDKAIELMEGIEKMEAKCSSTKQEKEEYKKEFERDRDEILAEIKGLESEIKVLEEERAGIRQAIDDGLLKRYEHLRKYKGGIAVGPVVKGVCQSCNIEMPPQKFIELIRGEEMMTCMNCNRIIFWGEDESFSKEVDREE